MVEDSNLDQVFHKRGVEPLRGFVAEVAAAVHRVGLRP